MTQPEVAATFRSCENNSDDIHSVFAKSQRVTRVHSHLAIPLLITAKKLPRTMTGSAKPRLNHPNPKNQAASFAIQSGKCRASAHLEIFCFCIEYLYKKKGAPKSSFSVSGGRDSN
jgi:hypothetical protein